MGTVAPPPAVRRASALLAEALTRHDAAAAAAMYAEGGRVITDRAHIVGRDEIEAYWRAGIALGLARATLVATDVRLGDGVAVETGDYELVVTAGTGSPSVVDRGAYLVLHRRDADGSWARLVDLFDPEPATPSAPKPLEGT